MEGLWLARQNTIDKQMEKTCVLLKTKRMDRVISEDVEID